MRTIVASKRDVAATSTSAHLMFCSIPPCRPGRQWRTARQCVRTKTTRNNKRAMYRRPRTYAVRSSGGGSCVRPRTVSFDRKTTSHGRTPNQDGVSPSAFDAHNRADMPLAERGVVTHSFATSVAPPRMWQHRTTTSRHAVQTTTPDRHQCTHRKGI